MGKKIRVAFAGLGNRGKDAYLPAFHELGNDIEIAAIADIVPEKVREVAERYNLPPECCYTSAEEMLKQPKLADAMCIATMDRQHVPQAIPALLKGYDLLLEKPISPLLEECQEINRIAKREGRKVIVCHVLRYTSYYRALKATIDSGVIGTVATVQAIENVGYWHQAHSFVRGNWGDANETSPMILQKCCHDMDLYLWLTGKTCKNVSSFGNTYLFKKEAAPKGAAKRCTMGCAAKDSCPFDAEKIYLDHPRLGIRYGNAGWPSEVLALHPTEASIAEAIQKGPYGRCVYYCDNNVVDHQVVCMEMTDGATMSFTMTGFTENNCRYAKIMGTGGEIVADMHSNKIMVTPFGQPTQTIDVAKVDNTHTGHGGGDFGLVEAFVQMMAGEQASNTLTELEASMESHYVAIAAEQSRLQGGKAIEIAAMR